MGLLGMAARTAVVAGTATHVAGNVQRRQQRHWAQKDAAQQPPQQQQQQQGYPAAAGLCPRAESRPTTSKPRPEPASGDLVSQLQRLGDLHTQGAITDEEFTAAKAKLLGG